MMTIRIHAMALLTAITLGTAAPVAAQDARTLASLAEQRAKMDAFDWADGIWRGDASFDMGARKGRLVQVERVGDFLGGSVKIVEGRGYAPNGQSVFNALAVIKWHPELKAYRFHSFANGQAGVFPVALKPDGYDWWVDSPLGTTLYETRVGGGVWHEIGYNVGKDGKKVPFFEMKLRRVADADWPSAVPMDVGKRPAPSGR